MPASESAVGLRMAALKRRWGLSYAATRGVSVPLVPDAACS